MQSNYLREFNHRAVVFCFLGLSIALTGCLKTRSDVSEEEDQKVIQTQVSQLQRSKAETEANYQNYESSLRQLNGRIETLEHQVNQLASEKEELVKKTREQDERFKQIESALLQLEQGVTNVSLRPTTPPPEEPSATKKEVRKRTAFDEGEEFFAQKQWKKAISFYHKYRDKNPTGPDFATATLKIGMCFQELKMVKEAKVFYEEVAEKFPKSKQAKTASQRLTQLKKK